MSTLRPRHKNNNAYKGHKTGSAGLQVDLALVANKLPHNRTQGAKKTTRRKQLVNIAAR